MIGYFEVLRSMIGHARAYRTRPTGEGKEGLVSTVKSGRLLYCTAL